MVGFLAPWFLGGLVAIGLPIYIHLLRRRQDTSVAFSSLMFFEPDVHSSVLRRRLAYLLLFSLRCLLIALLCLAFARPFLKSAAIAQASGGRRVLICIDDSFSMRRSASSSNSSALTPTPAKTYLEQAKAGALSLAGSLRSADTAQVLSLGGRTRVLTEMTNDIALVKAAISSIEPSDSATSYAELVRELRASSETPVEAHVFTDLQRTSMPASFADLQLNPNVRLVLEATGAFATPNFLVESVEAPARAPDPKKISVRVTVTGHGTAAADKTIELLVGSRSVAKKLISLPADGRAVVEFTAKDFNSELPYGLNRCEARISGSDAFPDDDHFLFSMERADPRPILLVDAPRGRGTAFVRTALESATIEFAPEFATVSQLGGFKLERYAFVMLLDTEGFSSDLESKLRRYVERGGALFIVPHGSTLGRVPVAGFPIRTTAPPSSGAEAVLTVASSDQTHPILAGPLTMQGVRFFQAVYLDTLQARVLARLSNGQPLLAVQLLGEGRILVFASGLDNVANDLPLHSAFVPFLQRTAVWLAALDNSPRNRMVGSALEINSGRDSAVTTEVLGPSKERLLSLSDSAKQRVVALDRSGFYEITRAGGKRSLVAVNPDRRESDFAVIPQEDLTLWRNTGAGDNAPRGREVPRGKNESETNSETVQLWRWVIALALLLALAESIVGNRYLNIKRTA